jgi:murein DD-endopeptidase MepM/ murein hydrolase activator NlpD
MENFSYIANAGKGRITSPFGGRYHPVSKKFKKHAGLDIAHPTGTEVLAMADGVVIDSKMTTNACGGTIAVDHGDINGKKIKTRFCHNSKLLKKVGDNVKKGDVIAISGGGKNDVGRGTSTGPHIHFEVYENGATVDPRPYYDGSIKINSQDIANTTQSTTSDSKPELSQTKKSDFEDIMKYLTTDTSKMTNQEKNKALMPLLSMLGLDDLRAIIDKPELTGDLKNQDEVKKELDKILAMNEEIKRFKRLII